MSRSGLEVVYRLCRGGIEVVLMWPTGCQEVVPRCSRSVLEVVIRGILLFANLMIKKYWCSQFWGINTAAFNTIVPFLDLYSW